MQAKYPDSKVGGDPDQIVLLSIGKFLKEEEPYYSHDAALEAELVDTFTNPDGDNSTELGDVPHAVKKGSVDLYPAMKSYYRVYESKSRRNND